MDIQDDYDNAMEDLLDAWGTSIEIALPSQNLQLAETSLTKAFAISEYLKNNLNEEKTQFVELVFNQISLVKEVLSSMGLLMEQRFGKALESLNRGQVNADKSLELYPELRDSDFIRDNELDDLMDMCVLNAKFLKYLMEFQKSEIDLGIKLRNNEYINLIKEKKKNIEILRKYFDEPWTDYNNELYLMHSSMLKRMIDVQERMVEKIKEEQKIIKYIRPIGNELFIVHGHDELLLFELKQMLRDSFDLSPIILKEEHDDGLTIIEKFEKYAINVSFVFVIITPDDFVKKDDKEYFQGRPNVLFELGWFYGRLGRNKVRILKKKNTETPSDLSGIITIDFNERLEEVFRKIQAVLESNGLLQEKP